MTDPQPPERRRELWDDAAATFDDEPDHGLRDPTTRAAWRAMLLPHLPAPPADVLDVGCGTGTLAVLLAQAGHRVRGFDLSGEMIAAATAKAGAAGVEVEFRLGDAADPQYPAGSCDVVLLRHVLWALPDPAAAVGRYLDLLRPAGRLVLVEGRWSTGAGIDADTCRALLAAHTPQIQLRMLDDPELWGGPIADERYLLVAQATTTT